jgi:hypothetical protein
VLAAVSVKNRERVEAPAKTPGVEIINSAGKRKTAARCRFSRNLGVPVWCDLCELGGRSSALRARGGATTIIRRICYGRRWTRSSIWATAGAIGPRDRLGVSRSAACERLYTPPGPAWSADPAGGWLFIVKHMHNLSDESLCARWPENRITNSSAVS